MLFIHSLLLFNSSLFFLYKMTTVWLRIWNIIAKWHVKFIVCIFHIRYNLRHLIVPDIWTYALRHTICKTNEPEQFACVSSFQLRLYFSANDRANTKKKNCGTFSWLLHYFHSLAGSSKHMPSTTYEILQMHA